MEIGSIPDISWSRVKLTPDLSFCHNLCYKCPNGSWEPILDICISIAFQWYKKLFDARCFDHCNRSLKVRESTGTPTSRSGSSLGSVSLHPHTLSHSSWPTSLHAFALIVNLRLGLRQFRPLLMAGGVSNSHCKRFQCHFM
jgi:hypothetical protein